MTGSSLCPSIDRSSSAPQSVRLTSKTNDLVTTVTVHSRDLLSVSWSPSPVIEAMNGDDWRPIVYYYLTTEISPPSYSLLLSQPRHRCPRYINTAQIEGLLNTVCMCVAVCAFVSDSESETNCCLPLTFSVVSYRPTNDDFIVRISGMVLALWSLQNQTHRHCQASDGVYAVRTCGAEIK